MESDEMEKWRNEIKSVVTKEYEVQHFRFHPRNLTDTIYNSIFECLFEALNAAKNFILKEDTVVTKEVELSINAIFAKFTKNLDKAIDKLEHYFDENIFTIPKNVVLPDDMVHVTCPSTKEDNQKIDMEIEEIKKNIVKERVRIDYLKGRLSQQDVVLHDLNCKERLGKLFNILKTGQVDSSELSYLMKRYQELSETIGKNKT